MHLPLLLDVAILVNCFEIVVSKMARVPYGFETMLMLKAY